MGPLESRWDSHQLVSGESRGGGLGLISAGPPDAFLFNPSSFWRARTHVKWGMRALNTLCAVRVA